ncbi:MAG: hypothetical protein BWY94_01081 [Actinobacteria bacterium ADurb.BinA094]|nr:MAG: hypothetical protein BWY94_01081 [Actinobacteria bacterium ADurb.BinA094]
MPGALTLDGQALVLAGLDRGRLDLGDLVAQQVELALPVAPGPAQLGQLSRECAGAGVLTLVRLLERPYLGGRRAVEQVELALELQQPRVLELAVEGEAAPQRLLDGRGAAQQAVHT